MSKIKHISLSPRFPYKRREKGSKFFCWNNNMSKLKHFSLSPRFPFKRREKGAKVFVGTPKCQS